ncbi:hypothetical protein GCM10020370_11200 [Paenibacillus hodogayensis]
MKSRGWIYAAAIMFVLSACANGPPLQSGPPTHSPQMENAADTGKESSGEPAPTGESVREPLISSVPKASVPAKIAYLTFDDGPSLNTEHILGILNTFGVKATFFVIGNGSEQGRNLYRKITDSGHAIGNHTFSHDYSTVYKSVASFKRDVEKLNTLLEQTTGKRPELLRFPGGSNNHQARKHGGSRIMSDIAAAISEEGYVYFDWNVSSTDAASKMQKREDIVESVRQGAQGKQTIIVLMHDSAGKTTTVEALPDIIRLLQEQGYRFQVLSKDSMAVRFLQP